MDESRIGQYSISVTTYPIMALLSAMKIISKCLQKSAAAWLELIRNNTI